MARYLLAIRSELNANCQRFKQTVTFVYQCTFCNGLDMRWDDPELFEKKSDLRPANPKKRDDNGHMRLLPIYKPNIQCHLLM